jgi:hypothetical protein
MKPNKRTLLAFLSLILWMAGCGEKNASTNNSMTFDDIRYVNKFPRTFTLDNPAEVETDIIGIRDLFIYDSLLVLSTGDAERLWSLPCRISTSWASSSPEETGRMNFSKALGRTRLHSSKKTERFAPAFTTS